MTTTTAINLGTGRLTWDGAERRSDRYGTVWLMPEADTSTSETGKPLPSVIDAHAIRDVIGERGRLVATVTATRKSTHIGDLFRGLRPRTPEVGDVIVLGTGTLFTEAAYHQGITVGLDPNDGRTDNWLDPRSLYDAHEQTVDLHFHPEN
jgi:hypothetical protein